MIVTFIVAHYMLAIKDRIGVILLESMDVICYFVYSIYAYCAMCMYFICYMLHRTTVTNGTVDIYYFLSKQKGMALVTNTY